MNTMAGAGHKRAKSHNLQHGPMQAHTYNKSSHHSRIPVEDHSKKLISEGSIDNSHNYITYTGAPIEGFTS